MSASSHGLELVLRPRVRSRTPLAPGWAPGWAPNTTTRAVLRRAAASGTTRTGLAVLAAIALAAVLAPVLATHDPVTIDPARRLLAPSGAHWLGTDDLGRDVFARLVYGARVSLVVAAVVSLASVALGTLIGLVAATGRWTDAALMRGVDGTLALPGILVGLAVVLRLGPGLPAVLVALTLVHTPVVARLVRTTVLTTLALPHVEAARAVGARPTRVLLRHVLPTALSPLLAQWSFVAGLAVLSEASLSFLGAGVGPDTPTWGVLLRDGQRLLGVAWWVAVPAGAALTALTLACTLVGDGVRDALDPRHRARVLARARTRARAQSAAASAGSTRSPSTSTARRGSGPSGGPKDR